MRRVVDTLCFRACNAFLHGVDSWKHNHVSYVFWWYFSPNSINVIENVFLFRGLFSFFYAPLCVQACLISNKWSTEFVRLKSASHVEIAWPRVVTKQYLKSQAVVNSATIGTADGKFCSMFQLCHTAYKCGFYILCSGSDCLSMALYLMKEQSVGDYWDKVPLTPKG